jgi:hypothetical protein
MPEEDNHHVAHDCFNRRRERVANKLPRFLLCGASISEAFREYSLVGLKLSLQKTTSS